MQQTGRLRYVQLLATTGRFCDSAPPLPICSCLTRPDRSFCPPPRWHRRAKRKARHARVGPRPRAAPCDGGSAVLARGIVGLSTRGLGVSVAIGGVLVRRKSKCGHSLPMPSQGEAETGLRHERALLIALGPPPLSSHACFRGGPTAQRLSPVPVPVAHLLSPCARPGQNGAARPPSRQSNRGEPPRVRGCGNRRRAGRINA